MNRFLKWVGMVNAATWLGATLFFTFVVGPAFFSEPALAIFGGPANPYGAKFYTGSMAQVVLARYFHLHQLCGGLALLHLVVSWIYTGRPLPRWITAWVAGAFLLGLLGGFWIQPKLQGLHRTMYGMGDRVTVAQADKARRSFGFWHGLSQAFNGLSLIGIAGCFWHLNRPEAGARFSTPAKFAWE